MFSMFGRVVPVWCTHLVGTLFLYMTVIVRLLKSISSCHIFSRPARWPLRRGQERQQYLLEWPD